MDKLYKIAHSKRGIAKGIAAAAAALFAVVAACGLFACAQEQGEVDDMYATLNTPNGSCTVELAKTDAALALYKRLKGGEITFSADDYGGFEKVGALGFSLPSSDQRLTAAAGDLMLYQGNSIVIFYGSNTWAYTHIGSIQGLSDEQLRSLLGAGQGSISVTLGLG